MPPKFYIFGDSHAGTLLRAARSLSLAHAGGSILAGRLLNDPFCAVEDGKFRMTSAQGVERLDHRMGQDGLDGNLLDVDMPFLCTVGFNTTNFFGNLRTENLTIRGGPDGRTISQACFEAVVVGARRGAFEFYSALVAAGKTVHAVLSPQRFSDEQKLICRAFETVMMRELRALGIGIVDVRAETTDETGVLRPEFASAIDHVHANDAFGAAVFERYFAMLNSPLSPTGGRGLG
jgi:hypothetical protein